MLHLLQILFIIISTVVLFIILNKLYLKVGHPILLPILTVTAITAIVLLVFNIPYDVYLEGGQWIYYLNGSLGSHSGSFYFSIEQERFLYEGKETRFHVIVYKGSAEGFCGDDSLSVEM